MSKYYTNPLTIVLKGEDGRPTFLRPNPDSENTNWYFTETPRKGEIIEIGKEYYEVVTVIFQAIRHRNFYDNPRHKINTVFVKYIGRFDKADLFASSK